MLREELLAILAKAVVSRPSPTQAPPFVGLDESVNNPILFEAVVNLCARDLAAGAAPLWNKRRIRRDGSVVYVLGGVTRGFPITEFEGVEDAKHATWPDGAIVSTLTAYFAFHDRLVLLTENTRLDIDGLRWLLLNIVAPILSDRPDDRFSLTALFKRGKIDWREYSIRVTQFIETGHFQSGYSEVRL